MGCQMIGAEITSLNILSTKLAPAVIQVEFTIYVFLPLLVITRPCLLRFDSNSHSDFF